MGSFISGNICFEFSVQCLGSAERKGELKWGGGQVVISANVGWGVGGSGSVRRLGRRNVSLY